MSRLSSERFWNCSHAFHLYSFASHLLSKHAWFCNICRAFHLYSSASHLPSKHAWFCRSLLGAIRRLCGTASSILNLLALALLSILVRIICPSNLMVLARSIMFAINGFLIRARGGVACSHTPAPPAPTRRSRRPKPNRGHPGGARCTTLSFPQVLARCLVSP